MRGWAIIAIESMALIDGIIYLELTVGKLEYTNIDARRCADVVEEPM